MALRMAFGIPVALTNRVSPPYQIARSALAQVPGLDCGSFVAASNYTYRNAPLYRTVLSIFYE